ncbi:MAG: acyl-ACP--UDP-N-acetylglucosamine O-acyltransferase, partial [Myxococcales bacterium]|nr:acyl-ACP--UDP-N-acetylglucosamine O-acyltransferase [Polyangiaceae bacterium]MDW8251557.1 acyl-ACP--UDP-N-acetylglucosamine O-acyltransferase [Myxococcales bacterium]
MSGVKIHPTAQVSAGAELGEGVEVGPYCVVGAGVRIGAGTRLLSHVVIEGPTELGDENEVHPFAVLGGAPQDRSYRGEPTRLEIGARNVFREQVTVNRGTSKDCGVTRIGSGGLFLAGCHIAHDSWVGDQVTLANGTLLAGHVRVEDHVVTGGLVAVQPRVRLGESCFLAGGAMVERDVPPFVIAGGDRARVRALNKVGLRRRGIEEESLMALERAFRLLFR